MANIRSACRFMLRPWLIAFGLAVALAAPASAEPSALTVRDTLGDLQDDRPAAARLLEQVGWQPGEFDVSVRRMTPHRDMDAVVSFATPRPSGDAAGDVVPLLWYMARDAAGEPLNEAAPAVLVVHTVHPQLLVGKAIARGFARQGLHAFVLQMPGFGERAQRATPPAVVLFEQASQAVADVRRARDAIAALPEVALGDVALQATSLGGFVATTAASLDNAFNPVMLAFTGGDGLDVLEHGQMDAAELRWQLASHGYVDQRLRDRLDAVEPLHVAHRLDPARTWLFSGLRDQVIPPANADALAAAIGLDAMHHVRVDADHYSAALHLPAIVRRMTEIVRETAVVSVAIEDEGD